MKGRGGSLHCRGMARIKPNSIFKKKKQERDGSGGHANPTLCRCLSLIGSENVVRYARENLYIVKTLKEFQLIDEDGKDQGSNGI